MRWLVGTSRLLRQQSRGFGPLSYCRSFADAPVAETAQKEAELTLPTLGWDPALDDVAKMLTTKEGQHEFTLFKQSYMAFKDRVEAATKIEPPVDWEYWKQRVDPELVEIFQKECDNPPPLPKLDHAEEFKKQWDELMTEAAALSENSKQIVVELKEELAKIRAELAELPNLTVDEYLARNPELAAEVDKQVNEGHFM